jgi:hypothetical protein
MPSTYQNDILPFAQQAQTGQNGGVLSQENYENDSQRLYGQSGMARSQLNNKVLRQCAHMAAGVAQYIANRYSAGVLDNADLDAVEEGLAFAIATQIDASASGPGEGGMPFGGAFPWPFEDTPPEGAIPLSADILLRADYPELWERAEADGNTISDDAWLAKLAANGSVKEFSSGNGSTTFRTPCAPKFILNADGEKAEIDEDGILRVKGGLSGLPLGLPFPWPYKKPCPGAVPALGSLSSRAAYPQVWELIKDDPDMCRTEAQWQAEYGANSGCVGFYSSGTDGANFRWPRIVDVFVRAGAAGRAPGSYQGDAIRNITGRMEHVAHDDVTQIQATGAFNYVGSIGRGNAASGGGGDIVDFDASRVVPTANENRPKNIAYPWHIKAFDEAANPGALDVAALAASVDGFMAQAEAVLNNVSGAIPVTVAASTQEAITPSGSSGNLGGGSVSSIPTVLPGLAAGTRELQRLLQELVNISHGHGKADVGTAYNCNCNCCGGA